jgi:hypothetical protein
MIKKGFYIILSLVVIVACNNNKIERPKKPDNLIKKDKMVQVLYDMSLITAAKGSHRKLIEEKGIIPDQLIFKKYEIDSLQFALSNEYYSYDIDTYEEIYEEVRNKINASKNNIDSILTTINNDRVVKKPANKKKPEKEPNSKLTRPKSISFKEGFNLIPYSEKISEWSKYVSGNGVDPIVVDNQGIDPNGVKNMSSVLLDLGGGKTRSDRSMIRALSIPVTNNEYVYSFWVKAMTPDDVGKTIRIIPEIKGGVEKIYTLTDKLERIDVINKITSNGSCNFVIEIRGEVTNSDIVGFYLWGVQFERSNQVSSYKPTWGEPSEN